MCDQVKYEQESDELPVGGLCQRRRSPVCFCFRILESFSAAVAKYIGSWWTAVDVNSLI